MTQAETHAVATELFGNLASTQITKGSAKTKACVTYEVGWSSPTGDFFFCSGSNWIEALEFLRDNPEPDFVRKRRLSLSFEAVVPKPAATNAMELFGIGR